MKIAVTGLHGQVVSALLERSKVNGVEVISVGRPVLDLAKTGTVLPAIAPLRPDAIVNAAAYTAVDQAEDETELACQINAIAPGEVAAAAHDLRVPIVHLSTNYVFNGEKNQPYVETDPIDPLNIYGSTKAAGERSVADNAPWHAILRTSWVYSPIGKNFVRTILRLAKDRDSIDIVSDQRGAPTSAVDVADGIFTVVKNLIERPSDERLRGVFHMTARGGASWSEFGEAILAASREVGGPFATVRPIASRDYPQAAKRPADSRLDCSKIAKVYGVRLPPWRSSLKLCVEQILQAGIDG